jgi:LysR family nitrogen assimilation transcriptional regulator
MDLRQLRYFVALATQQHYGKVAGVLHVTQPAL